MIRFNFLQALLRFAETQSLNLFILPRGDNYMLTAFSAKETR